jgi:hypothetical protein
MNQKELKNVLALVADRLNNYEINWTLIGSLNLFLQGIDVNVKDVDILTSNNNYEKIKKLFSDFGIKDESNLSNGDGIEIKYLINGVEVHFCLEYDSGFYIKKLNKESSRNNPVHLELNTVKIYCFHLQDELAGYKYQGRKDKVEIINNFLKDANRK